MKKRESLCPGPLPRHNMDMWDKELAVLNTSKKSAQQGGAFGPNACLGIWAPCPVQRHLWQEVFSGAFNVDAVVFDTLASLCQAWRARRLKGIWVPDVDLGGANDESGEMRDVPHASSWVLKTWTGQWTLRAPLVAQDIVATWQGVSSVPWSVFAGYVVCGDHLYAPDDRMLALRPKEAEVLAYLMDHGPLPRQDFVEALWGPGLQTRTLDTHIFSLRKALTDARMSLQILCEQGLYHLHTPPFCQTCSVLGCERPSG